MKQEPGTRKMHHLMPVQPTKENCLSDKLKLFLKQNQKSKEVSLWEIKETITGHNLHKSKQINYHSYDPKPSVFSGKA